MYCDLGLGRNAGVNHNNASTLPCSVKSPGDIIDHHNSVVDEQQEGLKVATIPLKDSASEEVIVEN
jgi:hypothetical protein